jgi:flagellar hook-associated protein 1 FlgK
MGSSFFGLNVGQTGLFAYKAALDTTAHNISNAETEGYSRQVMGQQASKALRVNSSYGMAGTGVAITGVKQQRDDYYDIKYWKNNTLYGEYSNKSHYMTEIENSFNDVSIDGFTAAYNKLNNSLLELQKNPSSLTVRTQVANYAKSLTEYFNSVSQNLKSIQQECNFEIRNQVEKINSTATQVAALTKQINTLEISGNAANDLRDQRALLVDKLSEIANVSVSEKIVGAGFGVTDYTVKLDGVTMVDGCEANLLKVVPREEKQDQNDIEGLYDIVWKNGQNFNTQCGGSLQGLFEVRDGNNQYNFRGATDVQVGDTEVEVKNSNVTDVNKLNIPEEGLLTIGNKVYTYSGFEFTKDSEDSIVSYKFQLDLPITQDAVNENASIGESIDFKGIPYYMSQLNEFARTYAKAFNDIHRSGVDLKGKAGEDFFTATSKVSGREYTFDPINGSDDINFYDYNTYNSQTGSYYEEIPEDQPLYGSYYFMTADNFTVNSDLIEDPNRMVTAGDIKVGAENNDKVDEMVAVKTNKMLFDQGAPDGFFQTLVAEIGIDTDKSNTFTDSQSNILKTIKNQRLSISGVDSDEEAMNLIRYQNAYNLSAKVISVMNEVYDKMINYMGV